MTSKNVIYSTSHFFHICAVLYYLILFIYQTPFFVTLCIDVRKCKSSVIPHCGQHKICFYRTKKDLSLC